MFAASDAGTLAIDQGFGCSSCGLMLTKVFAMDTNDPSEQHDDPGVRTFGECIFFRDVSQPFEQTSAVRRWCVGYYDNQVGGGTMFPVGIAYVVEVVQCEVAQMNFILVADDWRRKGIARAILTAIKLRWPAVTATRSMGPAGEALLKSAGLDY
jgi:GNAT superfamily N-acetyltransferase